MMNPAMLLKLKGAWDKFAKNHPKFPLFLKAASQQAIGEGSIILDRCVLRPFCKLGEGNILLPSPYQFGEHVC